MTGSRTLEARVESKPSDPYLFAAHDAVNVVVLLVVFGLPHAAPGLLATMRMQRLLHLLGIGWFFGGMITASVAVSRFIWTQPALDHEKLAHGFRFLLALEVLSIPSLILIAYGGMSMVSNLGGMLSPGPIRATSPCSTRRSS